MLLILQACLLFSLVPLLFLWRRLRSPLRLLNGPPNLSFWRGNVAQIFSSRGWQFHRDLVETYGGAVRLHGLFGRYQIYLTDPKALTQVLVKESHIYDETDWYLEGNQLVFGPGLLSTMGEQHKRQRRLLLTAFNAKHIKELTPIMADVASQLVTAVSQQINGFTTEIDLLSWMSRAALEIIARGGLGTSLDNLDPNSETETKYGKAIRDLIPSAFKLSTFRLFIPFFVQFGSAKFRRWVLDNTPSKLLQRVKGIVDVMDETSSEIYRQKKMALAKGDTAVLHQVGYGRDIMSILLRANLGASEQERLPEGELIAQMSIFMFAAHDTTSSALARTLHTLALNPTAQSELRREILVSGILDGEVSYDALLGLPYLDAVCRETLRLHPPINFMTRTARQDMFLPLGQPSKASDGVSDIYELFIPKGTGVIIGFGETNRRKTIWGEDAWEWKPQRWLAPLPKSVTESPLPGPWSSLMSFSAGPRSCIGFKFAELEMKMILASLIKAFIFELPDDKEIIWNLGGIQTPSTGGSAVQSPHMPMKISPVKS